MSKAIPPVPNTNALPHPGIIFLCELAFQAVIPSLSSYLPDVFCEVMGTSDKEQDIARIKPFSWFKLTEEVCHERLIAYDARQIANDPRSNSTEANIGPIKEKSIP